MESNVYNGKFNGNILIVGRTECGKTYFTQKLAINNFFSKLKKDRMGILYYFNKRKGS